MKIAYIYQNKGQIKRITLSHMNAADKDMAESAYTCHHEPFYKINAIYHRLKNTAHLIHDITTTLRMENANLLI